MSDVDIPEEGDRIAEAGMAASPEPRVILPQDSEAAAQALAAKERTKMLADPNVLQLLPQLQPVDVAPQAEAPTSPGVERWSVKTGTDPDVTFVNIIAKDTSIEALRLIPRPRDMPLTSFAGPYQSSRAQEAERNVWTIVAEITSYKLEKDGDYHLVVRSDNSYEMIVEIPDPRPNFVDPTSRFAGEIKTARATFNTRFSGSQSPQTNFKNASQRARITGVGFFDVSHGQRGFASTNGIELHPVLDIQWLDSAPGNLLKDVIAPEAMAPAEGAKFQPPGASTENRRIVITLDLTNI